MGSRPSNPPPRQCLLTVLDQGELIVASILYFRKRGVEFRNPIKIFRAGLSGRGSVFNRRAHQSHSRDYAVTPWCGKPMPTLGGKLRIPGRKAMKPRFPTILPESLHYSGTILLLCIHPTLLAISLAIGMMDLAYRRCRRG